VKRSGSMTGFDFPDFDPVALWLGPFPVRWYALAYLAGFLLGWWYARSLARTSSLTREAIDDFLPWAVAGVILGGRLGYVLFYQPAYFAAHPAEILYVWQGGMAFHGGLLGVIAALFIFAWRRRIEVLRLADILACAVPIGLFFGRIANFINGELFGRVTDLPWAVRFPAGGDLPRHPSQLYEAALEGAALFLILWGMSQSEKVRSRPGYRAGVFLIGYGTFRFIVEYVRAPDAHLGLILNVISMGQLLSLPMIILGCAVMIIAFARRPVSK